MGLRKYMYGVGLDLGCGDELAVDNAIGIDVAKGAATFNADCSTLPWFSDGSMDFVFSSFLLDRIEDDEAALREWLRVLKPGGYLILYLPHADYYPSVQDVRSPEGRKRDYRTWDVVSRLQSGKFGDVEIIESALRLSGKSYDECDKDKDEYSFHVVARKAPEQMPLWAYRRWHVPVEELEKKPFGSHDKYRIAVVHDGDEKTDVAKKILSEAAGDSEILWVESAKFRDVLEAESKAVVVMADLVVDLSNDGCSLEWAVSYDVDAVATCGFRATHPWPRQKHLKKQWETLLPTAVKDAMRSHAKAFKGGISLCMIAKNEKKHIRTALDSVQGMVDEIIVVDTGSSDETAELARSYGALVYYFPWRKDFSAARNYSLDRARREWTFWMDADDTALFTKDELLAYLKTGIDAFSCEIRFGGSRFQHARFWKTAKRVRFHGLCHEYPNINNMVYTRSPFAFEHSCAFTPEKDRIGRNIEIMSRSVHAYPNDARQWFYYGNALREGGKPAEALKAYDRYLEIAHWKDEKNICKRHVHDCHVALGDREAARGALLDAIGIDDRWAEQYFMMGCWYRDSGNTQKAAAWFEMAASTPLHDSSLFKVMDIYEWRAHDELVTCYEKLGRLDEAVKHAEIVAAKTGNQARLDALRLVASGGKPENTCDICGTLPEINLNAMGYSYVKCTCGVHYPVKGPLGTRDSKITPAVALSSRQWQSASEYVADYIHQHLKRLTGKDKLRILEIMPGAPCLSARLVHHGHDVSCVDACEASGQDPLAKGIDFRISRWEEFEVPEDWIGGFDAAVMIHAADHLKAIKTDLEKLVRCLKPGGYFFSRHPDADSPGVSTRAMPEDVFWVLDERSTKRLAEDLGLEVDFRHVKQAGGEADVWFKKSGGAKKQHGPVIISKDGPILVGRNGAVGDVLMTTYAVKKLKEQEPDREIDYLVHPSCSWFIRNNPHVRAVLDSTSPEVHEQIRDGVYKSVHFFEYPTKHPKPSGCPGHSEMDYPNKPLPRHLVDIFAECSGIIEPHGGEFGSLELFLTDEELKFGENFVGDDRVITLQTRAGWSQYKEWLPLRWIDVIDWCTRELGAKVVHLGGPGESSLYAGNRQPPEHYVDMRGRCDIRQSAAIMKHARFHLGIDSLYNHVTNAVRTPGVILWGSTHPTGSGYPHNQNVVRPPSHGCQPCYRERPEMTVHYKPPCPHNAQCMSSITVQDVIQAVQQIEASRS